MEILAIETSSAKGTLALYRDCRPVSVEEFQADRTHNSLLFAPLARLLKEAREPELLVAGTGPGSYTGIRVGLSAALGLSIARKIPLVGIPSICALAHAYGEPRYAVCADARRGMWWWAVVDNGTLSGPPQVGDAETIGRVAAAWQVHIFTTDPASPPFCHATPTWPRAEILAARASALTDDRLEHLARETVEPIYLAAPFITASKKAVFVTPGQLL